MHEVTLTLLDDLYAELQAEAARGGHDYQQRLACEVFSHLMHDALTSDMSTLPHRLVRRETP